MPTKTSGFQITAALFILAAFSVGGCRDFGDVTASMAGSPTSTLPSDPDALRTYAEHWGKIYSDRPGEKYASINYARALRSLTRYDEAAAVMQAAAVKAPKDFEVLGEYGKALADKGDLQQARDVLSRSYTSDRPNWDFMSAQGSVADRLDSHDEAQAFYRAALKIVPNEPSVLSNLGLSYALSKRLGPAEETLRQAASNPRADARVRQNLALVLALEGKFGEADEVSRHDMTPDDAARNVEAIRSMIAQTDSWRALQGSAERRTTAAPSPHIERAASPS